jgi:hypothetical protein
MKRIFSHRSKLSKSAITVSTPPWANRHQLITEVVTASVAAVGVITVAVAAANCVVGNTITVNGKTWTITTEGNKKWEIAISQVDATMVTNIVTALMRDYGPNSAIGDGDFIVATDGTGDTVDVAWCELGVVGNAITFTNDANGITMDGSGTLSSGIGTGTVEAAAAGAGVVTVVPHKAGGTIIDAAAQDFTAVAVDSDLLATGLYDSVTVTPGSLTATSSIRVIIHSWKE